MLNTTIFSLNCQILIKRDISEDLYQKLCKDIQKGIHFVDDPAAFEELNSCFDKHCQDNNIQTLNKEKNRISFSTIDDYLSDVFNIDPDFEAG